MFVVRMASQYTPEQLVFLDEAAKDERTLSSSANMIMIAKNVAWEGKPKVSECMQKEEKPTTN
jgi:hypothetical protein